MLSPPPPPNDIAPGRRPRAVVDGGDWPDPSSPARAEADPLLHDAHVPPPTQSRARMRRGKGGWLTRRCIAQRVLSLALPRTHLRARRKKRGALSARAHAGRRCAENTLLPVVVGRGCERVQRCGPGARMRAGAGCAGRAGGKGGAACGACAKGRAHGARGGARRGGRGRLRRPCRDVVIEAAASSPLSQAALALALE